MLAYVNGQVSLHAKVDFKLKKGNLIKDTSVGRIIFNSIIPDGVEFQNNMMGKKEIVVIDNMEYEKVQYIFSPTLVQRTVLLYPIFEEIPIEYEVEEDTLVQMKEKFISFQSLWLVAYLFF